MVEIAQLLRLLDSPDFASWRGNLYRLAASKGFESVLYGTMASHHASIDTAVVHSNYPAAWRQHYTAESLVYVDPTVSHCMKSCLPMIWVPQTFAGPVQNRLYEEARSHGIRTGVTLPMHGANGEAGMVSFATDASATSQFRCHLRHVLMDLSLIRDYAFEASLRLAKAGPTDPQAPHLTPREVEVLQWVMAGKTSWEISCIISCSEATINFHMANIRRKLNVSTRTQAMVKAISLGLIEPCDDPHMIPHPPRQIVMARP